MKRAVLIAVAALVVAIAAFPFVHLLVVESAGEVVVLTTTDARGAPYATHLWVVDHAGRPWVAAGTARAAWLAHLGQRPEARLERAGAERAVLATPVPGAREVVARAMRAKYGWADRYVRAVAGDDLVAVRLDPATPRAPEEPAR